MLPATNMAATETRHWANMNAPTSATPITMAMAITVARQARVRSMPGSAPWVALAKGPKAFSGPRVKKKMIKASGMET